MAWRSITVDDATRDFTPAELAVLRTVQNSITRLGNKVQDAVAKFIGAMSAARYNVKTDGTVPDQLREHIIATSVWSWLRGFPQYKAIKTQEREDAAKVSEQVYEQIVKRTYGALEDPLGTDYRANNWNSENKLIMRTHPIPPPFMQFPPFATGTASTACGLVFTGPAGTVPPFRSWQIGQQATNETTNEKWFVNSSNQWQQTQGV